jgi:hypothetical protein
MMLAIMEHSWTVVVPLTIIIFTSLVNAHSWVEELTVVSPNGTFTGAKGYPRGNVFRVPSFNDKMMQWQLPANNGDEMLPNMTMCRPSQQGSNNTADSPRLQAAPGDVVAMRYQENGHVTQPWIKSGKPVHSGTVYVYGTENPREDDTFLAIHKVWNLDGTGGDGRGKLLSTQYFDDGQCYQVDDVSPISVDRQKEFPRKPGAGSVEGANLWCQTDIAVPKDVTSKSTYTLYWVWDWPTLKTDNTTYMPEVYTTCIDLNIIDSQDSSSTGSNQANAANVAFGQVTNYGDAAIQSIFENVKTQGTQTVPPQSSTIAWSATAAAGSPIVSTTSPTAGGDQSLQAHGNSNCGTPTTVTVGGTTVTTTMSLPPTATTTVTVTTTSFPSSQPALMHRRRNLAA